MTASVVVVHSCVLAPVRERLRVSGFFLVTVFWSIICIVIFLWGLVSDRVGFRS